MPRGGINRGTMKSEWRSGKTCLVRVPIAIKEPTIKIARALDKLGELPDNPTILELENFEQAVTLLEEGLQKRANYGGQIKSCVREALALLSPGYSVEHSS
jgi:hypothetical protein